MKNSIKCILTIALFQLFQCASAIRILGFFPAATASHTVLGRSLMDGLVNAGHNVTFITPFPRITQKSNFRTIDISDALITYKEVLPSFIGIRDENIWSRHQLLLEIIVPIWCNVTLRNPKIQQLLNDPNEQFDVIVMAMTYNDVMLGIGHHFKAPVITVSTLASGIWINDGIGNPTINSYNPHSFLPFSEKMSFLERLENVLFSLYDAYYFHWVMLPKQRQIYDEVFPDPKPTLDELRTNVSLALVNSHFSFHYPRVNLPNVIEIGGINVNRQEENLSDELREILDNASDGVIYFSMGTNVKFADIPVERRNAIINVFGRLKEKVLWKLDVDDIPELPKNIYISKWFSQVAVLAHPNVKLFISHGGMLSLTEAVYYGLPVIGIPIILDQYLNVRFAVQKGYCVYLEYSMLDENSFGNAVHEVLNNQNYSRKAKILSKQYQDQPSTPLETAIFWIEYVVRHKGAPHLRSPGVVLNWWTYYSLDVAAFYVFSILIIVFLLKKLVKFIVRQITTNIRFYKVKNNFKIELIKIHKQ